MRKAKILIADDEVILTTSLNKVLTQAGYDVAVCNNGGELFNRLRQENPSMLMLDIYLGEFNGLRLLKQMKEEGWTTPVVMMTAHGEVPLAVEAMKEGATDFLTKPFDLDHLMILIEKTLEYGELENKVRVLQEELAEQRTKSGIIGSSKELHKILTMAERLASGASTTVLLEGESGSGKELFARFIYQKSPRAEKPFITINCGAIPKDLAESEFFGYEKGAFTGATEKMKQGKFELADGGTVLLDEIGELSLEMQVKLLRVLEERRFYRLGGSKEIQVDARVIAATNRNLHKEVEAGRFREDLFYRLNVAVIKIPPLRQRKTDIPQLTYAFLEEFSKKFNKQMPTLSSKAEEFLVHLPWRGNVRELRNAVERVLLLTEAPQLTMEHFSFLLNGARGPGSGPDSNGSQFDLTIPTHGVKMNEVVKDLILKTLTITNGNQVQAARVLGLTRSKLRYRMEQLGIRPEERSYKVENKNVHV